MPASGEEVDEPLACTCHGGISGADRAVAVALGAYLLWVAIAVVRDGFVSPGSVMYLMPPLAIAIGVVLGRRCVRSEDGLLVPAAALVLALLEIFFDHMYLNASAAVGVQLVAVAGLLMVSAAHGSRRLQSMTAHVLLAGGTGALGVLLALRSQATSVLVLIVLACLVLALRRRAARTRHAVLGGSVGSTAAAALAVVVLGIMPVWPQWLSDTRSLSGARHRLWGDAIDLWREHPVLGGGIGSFFEHSETARSEPHLYAAHSSILQVAAELGGVGALLLLAILVAGAFVASQGNRARGLIGVAAWCSLAVHSMIDHLYEFPIVGLLAGVVIGWAGSRGATVDRGNRPEHEHAEP